MIAAIWILTLLGLVIWTLLAAGLHALLAADTSWLVAFGQWLATMPGAGWLEEWWPAWHRTVVWMLQGLQGGLRWAGAAALWVVWLLWGVGTLLALLAAGGLHLLARSSSRMLAAQQGRPPTAGAA
ncbi:MAG: hypothetical protein ACKVQR_18700 [Aquabacterium sp.]